MNACDRIVSILDALAQQGTHSGAMNFLTTQPFGADTKSLATVCTNFLRSDCASKEPADPQQAMLVFNKLRQRAAALAQHAAQNQYMGHLHALRLGDQMLIDDCLVLWWTNQIVDLPDVTASDFIVHAAENKMWGLLRALLSAPHVHGAHALLAKNKSGEVLWKQVDAAHARTVSQPALSTNHEKYQQQLKSLRDRCLVQLTAQDMDPECIHPGLLYAKAGDIKSLLRNQVLTDELVLNWVGKNGFVYPDAVGHGLMQYWQETDPKRGGAMLADLAASAPQKLRVFACLPAAVIEHINNPSLFQGWSAHTCFLFHELCEERRFPGEAMLKNDKIDPNHTTASGVPEGAILLLLALGWKCHQSFIRENLGWWAGGNTAEHKRTLWQHVHTLVHQYSTTVFPTSSVALQNILASLVKQPFWSQHTPEEQRRTMDQLAEMCQNILQKTPPDAKGNRLLTRPQRCALGAVGLIAHRQSLYSIGHALAPTSADGQSYKQLLLLGCPYPSGVLHGLTAAVRQGLIPPMTREELNAMPVGRHPSSDFLELAASHPHTISAAKKKM